MTAPPADRPACPRCQVRPTHPDVGVWCIPCYQAIYGYACEDRDVQDVTLTGDFL
jgi:hypothetical protein